MSGDEYNEWKQQNPDKFLGWQPECECRTEYEPGIVLDMFAGSGTTGVAAAKLHRQFILIDLNKDYVAMMRRRLAPYLHTLEEFATASTVHASTNDHTKESHHDG